MAIRPSSLVKLTLDFFPTLLLLFLYDDNVLDPSLPTVVELSSKKNLNCTSGGRTNTPASNFLLANSCFNHG